MLERVLESEVMDSADEARDYDRMDHASVNRAFADDFWRLAGAIPLGPILDLGTGTALIPLELCKQHPEVQIVAVDAAASMLALAKEHLRRLAIERQIVLARVDAKRLPFRAGTFAAVISNSLVHHLPDPERLFQEAARVARRGATFFFRDLLRPTSEEALQQLVRDYAGGESPRQRRLFADSLRAALTLDEVRELVGGIGFKRDEVKQTSNRHWTWAGRC